MSSIVIVTDIFRVSYPHLKKPYKFNDNDKEAYRIQASFPQSGIGVIQKLGVQFESSPANIITAIQEVINEENWNWQYDPDNEAHSKMNGIQFPPGFKNGNQVLKKDGNGNPIPGEFCPISANNTLLNLNNEEVIGCASGVDLKPIAPGTVYGGCWGRLQLEVSAFTTKQNARVISVRPINFLMCYDDESFGSQGPTQSATEAFAGMNVTDSNLSVATGNSEFRTEPPVKPTPQMSQETVVMNPDCDWTYEELKESGYSDQDIVARGYGTIKKTPPPIKKTPLPVKKTPLPVKSVPTTGTVIMNPDCDFSYEELTKTHDWSDEDIINAGYATPNFTNPQ
ncbi:MAG: DUF2815 family protein [Colwellia sp.]|nr:DUF2815 family protein [Colwellia sp.]